MKSIIQKTLLLFIVISLVACAPKNLLTKSSSSENSSKEIKTLTEDGTWCWFSDPRAIYYSDNEVVAGWVKKDGSVEIASLNLNSGKTKFNNIYPQLEVDDHDNPAFTVLPDGNVFTMFAWHSTKKGVIYNSTSNGFDIDSFGENIVMKPKTDDLLQRFPRETYTYANPYVLSEENNRLFVFGRWIGFKPNLIISGDNGKTWDEQYVIMSDKPFTPGNRPYVKYHSDGKSRIHLIFTDGHPRNEPTNSVYYCYYEKDAFWKADGTKICDMSALPFHVSDASVVYKANVESGRAWIADIVTENDVPVILYSRHPDETDHRYHYAKYDQTSKTWLDTEICKAGKWFPQTQEGKIEKEPHYMGNLTVDPANPNVVYLSKQVNGVFEIEKAVTQNNGKTWQFTPITKNSTLDNVRPWVPRNKSDKAKTVVLWMKNKKYIHYTDYDTTVKYFIDSN